MPDTAPANRKRGRPPAKGSRTPPYLHKPALADSLSAQKQKASLNRSAAQLPATGTGDLSSVAAEMSLEELSAGLPEMASMDDAAPALPQTFTGYTGKFGLVKTNIVTSYAGIGAMLGGPINPDGRLFMESSERIADAWIAWGKADPRYMRIVTLLWGSPFMTLMVAHAPLVGGIMANHGISMGRLLVPMNMRNLGQLAALRRAANARPVSDLRGQAEAAPLPYQPVGPQAPTEAPGPPPLYADDGLRVFPDEGLPAELDVQLREVARTQGVPYQELRDQAMLQIAQMRMAQNGKVADKAAGLGMPVMKPE